MKQDKYIRRVRKVRNGDNRCERQPMDNRVIVAGIDPSLTGTALVIVASPGIVEYSHGWTDKKALQKRHPEQLSWYGLPEKAGHADRIARVGLMISWVLDIVEEYAVTDGYDVYAAIEGLAVSQRSNRASDLAELSGGIKHGLMRLNVPFRIYDPLTLKMAWTGQGGADKAAMVMQCFRRFRLDYTKLESAGDNFADATLLAQLLYHEVELRSGRMLLKDLDGQLRKIMRRTTKKEPLPLLKQPFVSPSGIAATDPIMGGP